MRHKLHRSSSSNLTLFPSTQAFIVRKSREPIIGLTLYGIFSSQAIKMDSIVHLYLIDKLDSSSFKIEIFWFWLGLTVTVLFAVKKPCAIGGQT